MATLTITEALAELKTLAKRLEKKRGFVLNYCFRQEHYKDPLRDDGGSHAKVASERQAILDLERRVVGIRLAINVANATTSLTCGTRVATIAEWLLWRREVAPGQGQFLGKINAQIQKVRANAQREGVKIVTDEADAAGPDVIINIDESALAREIEEHETLLGELDGKLSLLNATTYVSLDD